MAVRAARDRELSCPSQDWVKVKDPIFSKQWATVGQKGRLMKAVSCQKNFKKLNGDLFSGRDAACGAARAAFERAYMYLPRSAQLSAS